MQIIRRAAGISGVLLGWIAVWGTALAADPAPAAPPAAKRDGQHDFDFEVGSWKIHLKRRLNPLSGSDKWVEFDGTSVTRKVWDGKANLEEFDIDSPTGHIEGLTLRVYNPPTHQWSIYWASSRIPLSAAHPANGRRIQGWAGEFYDQDTLWQGHTCGLFGRTLRQIRRTSTVIFGRRGQNLGSELDYGPETGRRAGLRGLSLPACLRMQWCSRCC